MDSKLQKASPQSRTTRKPVLPGNIWATVKPSLWGQVKEVQYAHSILEAAMLLQTGKWFVSEAIIRPDDGSYLILMRVA